ncbi:MAG TPA: MFS transporter, partial [Bacteroidia bacterium]|nr:MFS transporter [Bacteroidia bacterium]
TLFYIAFFPGVIAIGFTFFVKEKKLLTVAEKPKIQLLDFIKYWKESPAIYRKLVGGLLVFALFNSSDVFLLLKIKEAGYNDTTVIGIYIFYNLIYALFSYPLGILADKIGMKKIFVTGLFLFMLVYFGMAYTENKWVFVFLFFVYGIYAAATEGIAKAWITNICERKNTATAIGTYTAFQSVATLIASSITGLIWYSFGASITFLISGIVALGVSVYVLRIKN